METGLLDQCEKSGALSDAQMFNHCVMKQQIDNQK